MGKKNYENEYYKERVVCVDLYVFSYFKLQFFFFFYVIIKVIFLIKIGSEDVYEKTKDNALNQEELTLHLGCCIFVILVSYWSFYVIIFQKWLASRVQQIFQKWLASWCCTCVPVRASYTLNSSIKLSHVAVFGNGFSWKPDFPTY